MFAAADLVVINKTDLLPYVDFGSTVSSPTAGPVNPASGCCRCR